MSNTTKHLVKGSGVVFFGRIFTHLMAFVFNFFVARELGPSSYGQFVLAFAVVTFFSLVLKLGFDNGLIYFIPKFVQEGKHEEALSQILFSIGITLALSLVASVLIYFSADLIGMKFFRDPNLDEILGPLAFSLIILILSDLLFGVFRGYKKTSTYVLFKNIIEPIVKVIVFLSFIWLGFSKLSLVFSVYIPVLLTTTLLFLYLVKKHIIKFRLEKSLFQPRELLNFSIPLLLSGIVGFTINKLDIFVIGYHMENKLVGIYNIAFLVGTLSSFLLQSVNVVFAPTISSLFHQNKIEELQATYSFVTKWVLIVTLLIFCQLLLFSRDIMAVFGEVYVEGGVVLIIIGLGQVINAATGPAGYINIMTGHPKYELYTNILVLVLKVILNLILITFYGILGVAIATAISVGITNLTKLALVYRDHKIHPYDWSFVKIILLFFPPLAFVFVLKTTLDPITDFDFVGYGMIFTTVYALLCWILILTPAEKMTVSSLLRKKLLKN